MENNQNHIWRLFGIGLVVEKLLELNFDYENLDTKRVLEKDQRISYLNTMHGRLVESVERYIAFYDNLITFGFGPIQDKWPKNYVSANWSAWKGTVIVDFQTACKITATTF